MTFGRHGTRVEGDEDYYMIWPCIQQMETVKNQIEPELEGVNVEDIGKAVWSYKSTQSLLTPYRMGNRLSPKAILDFLDENRLGINSLVERLVGIEQVDSLAEDLKSFLESRR